MKFKIGDKVVGNEASNEEYCLTCKERGFIGEVIAMDGEGGIRVKVLSIDNNICIGKKYWVEPEYFEKVGEKIEKTILEKPKKIYLASPFFNDEEIGTMENVLKILRDKELEVFAPFEHQNKHLEFGGEEWRRATFVGDMKGIYESDVVVAILDGNYTDSGTSAECMAAYLLKKKLIVVNLEGKPINLMIAETVHAVINSLEELEAYDFEKLEPIPYTDYVW